MASAMLSIRTQFNTREYPSLVPDAPHIVVNVDTGFVVLEDVSWPLMLQRVREYCSLHDETFRAYFLAPSHESMALSGVRRILSQGIPWAIRNLDAPHALRLNAGIDVENISKGPLTLPKPATARASAIRQAVVDAGLVFHDSLFSPSYWDVTRQPYEVQRAVAACMLTPEALRSMAWAFPGTLETIASQRLIDLAQTCQSTEEFLFRIATLLLDWLNDGSIARSRTRETTAGRVRPWTIAWFAIWLAEQGGWLFPQSVVRRATEMQPARWHCMRWTLVPPSTRTHWETVVQRTAELCLPSAFRPDADPDKKRWGIECARASVAALRWTSTWRDDRQISADFLSDTRAAFEISGNRNTLTALWDLNKGALTDVDRVTFRALDSQLRARRVRRSGNNVRAWPWVDDPAYQPQVQEKYCRAGCKAGPNLLSHVQELRDLLPRLSGKIVSHCTQPLSVWLMYLAGLPDTDVPPRLLDIERAKHIERPGDPSGNTLHRFTRSIDFPLTNALHGQVYSKLETFWAAAYELAAPANRPSSFVCPVLPRFDAPRMRMTNKGQTHRRPLDEELLLFLIATNRADDFAFSRSRKNWGKNGRRIDYRRVTNARTGEVSYEWFPGLAVLMDVLFAIPLRKKQARYLDSGEGDEFQINIETLALTPSTRQTAQKGRAQGFFRRHNTALLEDQPVLGMYINTNKTGSPYEVPWIPMDVARNVQRVINWQEIYNPIVAPVPDRDHLAINALIDDRFSQPVWPIFREPSDALHQPISDSMLQTYFEALMAYCEGLFNAKTGRDVSFFHAERQEKKVTGRRPSRRPIIDLHSLRVTGVTMLIENGVPLTMVQLLVGHASIAMTCYYHVIESRKVHIALMQAMESRAPTLEQLRTMSSETFAAFTQHVFNRTSDPTLATSMLSDAIRQRTPGWDFKYHGLCAGGDCRFGGPPDREEGGPTPLWRADACSLCRYRVTGAPFLVGLIHHVNQLWWELRQGAKDLAALQLRKGAAEDNGQAVRSLAGDIERAKIRQDHLFEEWIAEVNYVNQAKQDLDRWVTWSDRENAGTSVNADHVMTLRSPMESDALKVQLNRVHELAQMTDLLCSATILQSAVLPRGIKEDRNAILLDIARAAHIDGAFMQLSRADAERAFDLLAELILDAVSQPEDIEELAQGRLLLSDVPGLPEKIVDLFPAFSSLRTLLCLPPRPSKTTR